MNECCKKLENRKAGPGPRGFDGPVKEEVVVTHCSVCDCRHYEATLDPAKIGVTGSALT